MPDLDYGLLGDYYGLLGDLNTDFWGENRLKRERIKPLTNYGLLGLLNTDFWGYYGLLGDITDFWGKLRTSGGNITDFWGRNWFLGVNNRYMRTIKRSNTHMYMCLYVDNDLKLNHMKRVCLRY